MRKSIPRREALRRMGAVGAGYALPGPLLERFLEAVQAEGGYQARFFGEAELETVRLLADMIIPRDERSGSASDAGTVDYMDFVLSEAEAETRERWRAGLAWLDAEVRERHGTPRFVDASPEQRGAVLDLVAWPERAEERHQEQVEWFNRARDLVGSGFFSSRMGVEDLDYRGGGPNAEWNGVPAEVLEALGLSYDDWDRRYGSLG